MGSPFFSVLSSTKETQPLLLLLMHLLTAAAAATTAKTTIYLGAVGERVGKV